MVAEDSSVVQQTLWKETYMTLGTQYPESWSLIALKKSFVPGLMTCLKNAGFGATFSLYPNLVKFSSVFPMFQLGEDSKFSLKDRAKFVT